MIQPDQGDHGANDPQAAIEVVREFNEPVLPKNRALPVPLDIDPKFSLDVHDLDGVAKGHTRRAFEGIP